MNETGSCCAECGSELPSNVPTSLCPRCALSGVLKPGADLASGSGGGGTPPEQPAPLPRDFGDYELNEEIARGGMGVVYRARQKSLGRIVAVKMLLAGSHADFDTIRRFRVEAVAAGSLKHPNIVGVHEVGRHEGHRFIAMDFVAGPNLARVARKPLPPRRAAELLATIAEAIHYAHEHRVLHRDLKPSNIIVDEQGQPHVTDFGLAKELGTSLGDDRGPEHDSVSAMHALRTADGQVLGSPAYMPPEQADGKVSRVGRWSDVYSLGAMLYHLLTGKPPFSGSTVAQTLHSVLHEDVVPPRRFTDTVPLDLETICLKCLEKDPARRYQTAGELADELGRFLRNEPIRARPISPVERVQRWASRNRAAAALIVALILGLGGTLGMLQLVNASRRAEIQANIATEKALTHAVERLKESLDGLWGQTQRAFLSIESDELHMLARHTVDPIPESQTIRRLQFAAQVHENPVSEALRYEPLLAHLDETLSKRLGQPVRFDLRLYKPGPAMWDHLADGQVHFSRLGALVYLRGSQGSRRVTTLVQQRNPGKQGVFFARTNSGISTVAQLRGRSLALGDTNSTISVLALAFLATNGISAQDLRGFDFLDPNEEFQRDVQARGFSRAIQQIGFLHSHAEAIESVIAGRHDAGVAQPKFILAHRGTLEIIPGTVFESTRNPWVIHADLPRELVDALRDAMTSLRRFGWLEEIPDKPEGFAPLSDSEYEPVRKALEKAERAFPPTSTKP